VLLQDLPEDRMEVILQWHVADTREAIGPQNSGKMEGSEWLIDNPGLIPPTGLNKAIGIANGDIVIRVDGHWEIASRLCEAMRQTSLMTCRRGRRSNDTIGEPTSRAIALAMSSRFGVGGTAFRMGTEKPMLVDTGRFGLYT